MLAIRRRAIALDVRKRGLLQCEQCEADADAGAVVVVFELLDELGTRCCIPDKSFGFILTQGRKKEKKRKEKVNSHFCG